MLNSFVGLVNVDGEIMAEYNLETILTYISEKEKNLVECAEFYFRSEENRIDSERSKLLDDYKAKEYDKLQNKATLMIEDIKRDLFNKKRRDISNKTIKFVDDDPEMICDKLENTINKFESSKLPRRVRRFVDNLSNVFNRGYKQAEVDEIINLYEALKYAIIQKKQELDSQLDEIENARNNISNAVKDRITCDILNYMRELKQYLLD